MVRNNAKLFIIAHPSLPMKRSARILCVNERTLILSKTPMTVSQFISYVVE